MKIETAAQKVYKEYERGLAYNTLCDYYFKTKQHENFYIGNQWAGINAPDLDKPVLNFIRRVCAFLTAMVASDDMAIYISPYLHTRENLQLADMLNTQIEKIAEASKLKSLSRQVVLDSVVKGDGFLYWYYSKGQIKSQVLQSKNIIFANPYSQDLQRQPYILIEKSEFLENVKEEAAACGGESGKISAEKQNESLYECAPMVKTITKLYKQDGEVWYTKCTKEATVVKGKSLGYKLYPIAKMSWETQSESYHGVGAVENLIPNQIAVNKLWAMALLHQRTMAFPKIFFDKTKMDSWTNKVGAAIGVMGNPNEVIASSFKANDMSLQVLQVVDKTISYTKEFMGANDTSLGNVAPQNTSAIIAVQRSATIPLENQKQAYSQFLEDCVLIMLDLIAKDYGEKLVEVAGENGEYFLQPFDFSKGEYDQLTFSIQAENSSLWSESIQAQTLENLYTKQIITDAYDYVQAIPQSQLKNKQQLLKKLKEKQEAV